MPSCGLPRMTSRACRSRSTTRGRAAPHRPVGVLEVEDGGPGVRAPGAPEEERVGGPGRVVGEDVEEAVDDLEAAREAGGHHREVLRGRAQVANRRLHVAGERPDLVADDRRGLAEERLRLAQRRREVAGERTQPLERGPELCRPGRSSSRASARSDRARPGTAAAPRAARPPRTRTPRSWRSRSRRARRAGSSRRASAVEAPGSCGSRA